jgi:hypothetical protein
LKPSNTVNEISLLILWLIVAAIAYATITGWVKGQGLSGGWNWITTKFSVAKADTAQPLQTLQQLGGVDTYNPGPNGNPISNQNPLGRPGGQAGGPQF